jgi:hypothetical protein
MEIKDETYRDYATTKAKNVPPDDIKHLVNMFLVEAARDMGTDLKDETIERVISLVRNEYGYLPVCYIASAFRKGALGDYGAGRLVPRTVYQWLSETSVEYNREARHQETEERFKVIGTPVDLKIYPMGSAINQKIDWLTSDAITSEQWDEIDLKKLAFVIGKKQTPILEDFITKN